MTRQSSRTLSCTPDFLFTDTRHLLVINGEPIKWIEAKCFCLPGDGEKRKSVSFCSCHSRSTSSNGAVVIFRGICIHVVLVLPYGKI